MIILKDIYVFPAILSYAKDGITVDFPDLPGCLSSAATTEEAMGLHLWSMERDNDEIPSPTEVAALKLEEGEIPLMVDVFMPPIRERQSKQESIFLKYCKVR